MAKLHLSFANGGFAERFKPLGDGSVKPEGIDLTPTVLPINELFWRVVHDNPFDVTELAITEHFWDMQGKNRWIAVPVFPGFVFSCHTETLVNANAGIKTPADLRGKRIGIPEYGVAAITWIRHALESEYGVRAQDVSWFEERLPKHSHLRAMGWQPPAGLRLEVLPEEKRLCDMLVSGEVDAVTRYFGRRPGEQTVLIDRSLVYITELAKHPNVRWLYPDRIGSAIDYCKKIGFLQPIHYMVIKREVVTQHPWVPRALYDAMAKAYRGPYARPFSYDLTKEEQDKVLGPDFLPFGLKRNRPAVEKFLELSKREGFASDKLRVEDCFHESTLDT